MPYKVQLPIIFDAVCEKLVPVLTDGEFTVDPNNNSKRYIVTPLKPDHTFEYVEVELDSHSVTVSFGDNSIVMRSDIDGKGYHSFMNDTLRETAFPVSYKTIDAMIEHAGSIKWT